MAFLSRMFGGLDPKRLCRKLDDDVTVIQEYASGGSAAPADGAGAGKGVGAAEKPAKIVETLAHLHKQLNKMRGAFFGDPPENSVDTTVCEKIGEQVVQRDLFKRLILALPHLEFETRKLVEMNFIALNHNDYGNFSSRYLVDVTQRPLLDFLVRDEISRPYLAMNAFLLSKYSLPHNLLLQYRYQSQLCTSTVCTY